MEHWAVQKFWGDSLACETGCYGLASQLRYFAGHLLRNSSLITAPKH